MVESSQTSGGRKVSAKTILLGVLAAVLVLFAVLNTEEVEIDWIFGSVRTPLIVMIVVCGALGFAIGYLVRAHRGDGND
jgi:uncharacterized integral membrane protein